jgi:hypothetical protein
MVHLDVVELVERISRHQLLINNYNCSIGLYLYTTSNPKCCSPCIPTRIPKSEMSLIRHSGLRCFNRLVLYIMITNIASIKNPVNTKE